MTLWKQGDNFSG